MGMLEATLLAAALFLAGGVTLAIGFMAAAQASVNNKTKSKWVWTAVNLLAIATMISGIVVAVIWGP